MVMCTLIGAAPTLFGCWDDQKEIVVVESRPMRGQAVQSCSVAAALPAIEWDSELEFGCTGGMPCPLLAANSESCADNGDGMRPVDSGHSIVTEARREPRCDGIVVIESAVLGTRPLQQSIQRPHWILEIVQRSSEERQPWVLVRHKARMIRASGQGTAAEIVREMCTLVRESAASQKRGSSAP
jgi:hypothetical protein